MIQLFHNSGNYIMLINTNSTYIPEMTCGTQNALGKIEAVFT